MNGDLDAWLNDGIAETLAALESGSQPAPVGPATPPPDPGPQPQWPPPPPAPEAPPPNGETKRGPSLDPPKPKSLAERGISLGGVIRNPTTTKRVQLNNPVINPKVLHPTVKSAPEPTPEQEAKAYNPKLAIPSILTGMDLQTDQPEKTAPKPMTLSLKITLGELLEQAKGAGGRLCFANEDFVISLQVSGRASV